MNLSSKNLDLFDYFIARLLCFRTIEDELFRMAETPETRDFDYSNFNRYEDVKTNENIQESIMPTMH